MKRVSIRYATRLFFIFAVLLTFGCAVEQMTTTYSSPPAPPAAGQATGGPVLEDMYAHSYIPNGGLWKVYVQGSDPAGNMTGLWVTTTQLGKKTQDDFIPLKGEDRSAFSGFIEIPTAAFFNLAWDFVRIDVRIKDAAGHYSREGSVEAELGHVSNRETPAKWASAHRLGSIIFHFENPNSDGQGNDFD
jgi:hypothetical protein